MRDIFIFFLIFSLILASLTQDRIIFTILYLFLGALLLGLYWSRKSIRSLEFERKMTPYAFINETVQVDITIQNTGWLPVPWLKIQDALPNEISEFGSFRQILSLGPKEKRKYSYLLAAKKRGYYRIGPFSLVTGDLFGLANEIRSEIQPEHLTVYPRVVPLKFVKMPSSSPIGVIRNLQPIFEDPCKCAGKRDYLPGDSMRRIDWKTSAAVGRFQVKVFDPSIDLQVFLVLNLNLDDYETKFKSSAIELAILSGASISRWVIDQRLAIGLHINGIDQGNPMRKFDVIPPIKGRTQLIRILESLARSQSGNLPPITDVIAEYGSTLGWGTTLILITGSAHEKLLDQLFRLRRQGIQVVLIICGEVSKLSEISFRAKYFGIPVYSFVSEKDLDIWRR
jgi:uncharacterized protein (DUF58 family)